MNMNLGGATLLACDHDSVLRLLSNPATYSRSGKRVDIVETHISWVFLVDRFVYKLKKPVKFDFVDFSNPKIRLAACEDEVRLNRRLAPSTYLGVVPITRSSRGHYALGGSGQVVDWVVKMRRLPADRSLDQLIRTQTLSEDEVETLATTLADFYRALPPLSIQGSTYRELIEKHVIANYDELSQSHHELDAAVLQRIQAALLRILRTVPWIFDRRVCDGRVAEGHGDLRPEHIYLLEKPVVIDCVEFSRELRQLDVVDELSFLTMECDFLGSPRTGRKILEKYIQSSGDSASEKLILFYSIYRACVRAKVMALRAHQMVLSSPDDHARHRQVFDSVRKYLDLADGYVSQLGKPLVLIVRGLSGSGKSTLANSIAASLGLAPLATDSIRRERLGRSPQPAAVDQGNYTPESRNAVYEEMFRRAEALMRSRIPVVMDGTFLATEQRRIAVDLANQHGMEPIVLHCHCPDEIAGERIASRLRSENSESEAWPELLESQRHRDEPDPENVRAYLLDTTESLPDLLEKVYRIVDA